MGSGIRAEVRIDADGSCPISQTATATGAEPYSISRSVDPAGEQVTEEFMLDVEEAPTVETDVTHVFSYGDRSVYRFDRERGRGCPCECVEQFDCPVVDVHARDGDVILVFHVPDMETLQSVVQKLTSEFPSVDIQRLLRSEADADTHDLVFVDRGALTDRQREVLETAHDMGYFDHPKGANAGEVAAELGITASTFTEHVAAAQTKLLADVLDSS